MLLDILLTTIDYKSYLFIFFMLLIVALIFFISRLNKRNLDLIQAKQLLEKSNENLSQTIKEKESLFSELHHRVKNNLSLLSGLLYIQKEKTENIEAKKILENSINRIQSIANVHQQLYVLDAADQVDFEQLISDLMDTFLKNPREYRDSEFKFMVNIPKVKLSIQIAVPISLIINELVTNSVKHARTEGFLCKIFIDAHLRKDDSVLELIIGDNGKGFPEEVLHKESASMGMQLIRILSNQLNAELIYNKDVYTGFKLIVPLTDHGE